MPSQTALPRSTSVFQVERVDDTLIITPRRDLRELEYQQIERAAGDVLLLLENGTIRNAVLDFRKTDYYGSTALGFFLKLWKRIRSRGGHLAFCNVSRHEREILRITKLDGLWPIFASQAEALRRFRE
jgi:anti-anti-sigma factor